MLSEDTQTSDTPQQKLLSAVRRYQNFRHASAEIAQLSPKIPKLQTQPSRNCLAQSEDTKTSDTAQPNFPCAVRRYQNFGHASAEIALCCPKIPRLQTHMRKNCLALSEDTSTSYTPQQKFPSSVRSLLKVVTVGTREIVQQVSRGKGTSELY